jgi:hypothetical protein
MWDCGQDWRLEAEGFIEVKVVWDAGSEFLSADNMAYLHFVIVDNVGKVIGRIAIRFDKDEVVYDFGPS